MMLSLLYGNDWLNDGDVWYAVKLVCLVVMMHEGGCAVQSRGRKVGFGKKDKGSSRGNLVVEVVYVYTWSKTGFSHFGIRVKGSRIHKGVEARRHATHMPGAIHDACFVHGS